MIPAVLLLCCILLYPVAAFPRNAQTGAATSQPSFTETGHPVNTLSNQIPLLDPKTCQDLLHTAPSLAPLPEYLSNLALEVVLEGVGCPTEAHILQLQLVRMGGKDATEILIRESKKHNEEEGVGNTKVILGETAGELRRVQRSVTLLESCQPERRQVFNEMGQLLVEYAEKLPSTELVREFKAAVINFTQECTEESWVHLETVGKQLMESPEIKNFTMSGEDQLYFVKRVIIILIHYILSLINDHF